MYLERGLPVRARIAAAARLRRVASARGLGACPWLDTTTQPAPAPEHDELIVVAPEPVAVGREHTQAQKVKMGNGNDVSWFSLTAKVVKLVSWPMLSGNAVSWFLSTFNEFKRLSWPRLAGNDVNRFLSRCNVCKRLSWPRLSGKAVS